MLTIAVLPSITCLCGNRARSRAHRVKARVRRSAYAFRAHTRSLAHPFSSIDITKAFLAFEHSRVNLPVATPLSEAESDHRTDPSLRASISDSIVYRLN